MTLPILNKINTALENKQYRHPQPLTDVEVIWVPFAGTTDRKTPEIPMRGNMIDTFTAWKDAFLAPTLERAPQTDVFCAADTMQPDFTMAYMPDPELQEERWKDDFLRYWV